MADDLQLNLFGDDEPLSSRVHLAVLSCLATVCGVVSLVLRVLHVLSSPAVAHLGGATSALAGTLLLGRSLIHIFCGRYLGHRDAARPDWTDRHRRRLNALCLDDVVVSAGLLAVGVLLFFSEPHYWRQLAITCASGLVVWTVVSKKHDLVCFAGLDRGTETVRACPVVTGLREEAGKAKDLPGIDFLDKLLWVWRTPTSRLSGLVLTCLAMLFFVGLADGVAIAPQVRNYVSQSRPGYGPPSSATPSSSTPGAGSTRGGGGTGGRGAPRTATPKVLTYHDLCGGIEPGDGITGPMRDALHEAWYLLGEPTAGCAERAVLVPGTQAVYVDTGQCDGRFVALGVVSPDHPAVVLLDAPAAVALTLMTAGTLRGASARTPIGQGDFVILYTTRGAWVIVRSETTDGNGGLRRTPTRCEQVHPGGARYTVLPPSMATLWLRLAGMGIPSWPVRDEAHGTREHIAFRFLSPDLDRTTVASGWCMRPADRVCKLRGHGITLSTDGSSLDWIDVDRVLRLGPRG